MEAGLVHCTPENAMLGHRSEHDLQVREFCFFPVDCDGIADQKVRRPSG